MNDKDRDALVMEFVGAVKAAEKAFLKLEYENEVLREQIRKYRRKIRELSK